MTPEEKLYQDVLLLTDKQEEWIGDLILDKLGFNWGTLELEAGEHDIYFGQPYAADQTAYHVRTSVLAYDGGTPEDIGCVVKERHEAYFKVWVSSSCIFSYLLFNPKI